VTRGDPAERGSLPGRAPSPQAARSETTRQFTRFLVVGLGNTAVSFVAYRLLLAGGTPYAVAAPVAFAVGAVNGYVLNGRWTFAARDTTRARVLYVAVQALGAASTSLLVFLFVHLAGADREVAYLAAVPPVTVCLFAANRFWVFAGGRALRAEDPVS
jgi:putative flippase GtrA